jgi:hypothetical protein
MGAGSSVTTVRKDESVLVSENLVKAAYKLAGDPALRECFVNYIKSGNWMGDIINHSTSPTRMLLPEEMLAHEYGKPVFSYRASDETRQHFREVFLSGKNRLSSFAPESFTPLRASRRMTYVGDSTKLTVSWESYHGSYTCTDNFCMFTQTELIAALFGIILPLFEDCQDNCKCSDSTLGDGETVGGDSGCDLGDDSLTTRSSQRARDCLLSCAANFDGVVLYEHLARTTWVDSMNAMFDNYHLPITIFDNEKPSCPIIYANHAFLAMVGCCRRSVLGQNLDMLVGPDTEAALLLHFQRALRFRQPCKVAITHYTSAGVTGVGRQSFLNLLSVKTCGSYVFAVHCPECAPTELELNITVHEICIVDNFILFLYESLLLCRWYQMY